MKWFILICFALTLQYSNAQRRSFTLGGDFSMSQYDATSTTLYVYSIQPGVEFRSGLMMSFGMGYLQAKTISDYKYIKVRSKGIQPSFSVQYRMGRYQSRFSTIAGLTFGSVVFNSERSCYLYNERVLPTEKHHTFFDKLRFFTKAKMLLDFEVGQVNLRGGPTYTFNEMRVNQIVENRTVSDLMRGFGLEFGIHMSLEPRIAYQGVYIPSRGRI